MDLDTEYDIEVHCVDKVVDVTAFAPSGYIFKTTFTHSVVACSDMEVEGLTRTQAVKVCRDAILADIAGGVEKCEEEDCDVCAQPALG